MKILLINYRYFISGGPERYMFNVKLLLEEKGHEVIPFSVKSVLNVETEYEKYFVEPMGGQDEPYFDKARLTPKFFTDVVFRLFYSFDVKFKLKKIIDATKPDVAYILHHYNKLSPSVIDACKEKKIPVYLRLSDFYLLCPQAHFLKNNTTCERCLDKGVHSAVLGRCVKGSLFGSLLKAVALFFHKNILKIYDRVDGYICTTEFMKSKMMKGGWKSEMLTVIPTFSIDKKTAMDSFEGVNDKLGYKYILYFGRFSKEKGIDLLVRAYLDSLLPKANIKLLLVGGSASDINEIMDLDFSLDIVSKNIKIKGFQNSQDLSSLISSSMFVVVPSRWYENMPNTVIEAYSYGKAVIAMDIGSMPEIVIDGVTGFLFEKENCDDLRNKINKLVDDEKLLAEVSKNASVYCTKKMNPDSHIEKLTSLFAQKTI